MRQESTRRGGRPPAKVTRAKAACVAAGIRPGRLRSGAFGEAGDGFGFGVVDIEDGQQLGDLEDFLELAAQVAETQRSALRLDAVMSGNEGAQPGAVDESDVVHVEDNFLFSFGDQALDLFTQGVAFLAEYDTAVQRQHRHAIHFAVSHLQSHVISSSSESGSGGNPGRSRKAYQNMDDPGAKNRNR